MKTVQTRVECAKHFFGKFATRSIIINLIFLKTTHYTSTSQNGMHVHNPQKSIFGAINFTPLQFLEIMFQHQLCRGVQNSLNRDPFQYLTPKHHVHTSGTLRTGFADF